MEEDIAIRCARGIHPKAFIPQWLDALECELHEAQDLSVDPMEAAEPWGFLEASQKLIDKHVAGD